MFNKEVDNKRFNFESSLKYRDQKLQFPHVEHELHNCLKNNLTMQEIFFDKVIVIYYTS